MKLPFLLGLVAVAIAAPLGVASSAPEPEAPPQCFGSEDIVNWTAPGNRILNLRLRDGSVIQGALRGPCPSFNTGDTIAFSAKARRICRGSDLMVIAEVSRVRHADDTQVAACGFTRFRKLSIEEVAALPSQSRP